MRAWALTLLVGVVLASHACEATTCDYIMPSVLQDTTAPNRQRCMLFRDVELHITTVRWETNTASPFTITLWDATTASIDYRQSVAGVKVSTYEYQYTVDIVARNRTSTYALCMWWDTSRIYYWENNQPYPVTVTSFCDANVLGTTLEDDVTSPPASWGTVSANNNRYGIGWIAETICPVLPTAPLLTWDITPRYPAVQGSVAYPGCSDPNFEPDLPAPWTCSGVAWSPSIPPTCVRRMCATLAPPSHGQVAPAAAGWSLNVTYTCDHGHTLEGARVRQCLEGSYTDLAPTCVANPCAPNLVAPAHATLTPAAGNGTTGDVAVFACLDGYHMVGNATRTCSPAGVWSGTASPECLPVSCGSLQQPPPLHGNLTCQGPLFGNNCTVTCKAGYSAVGDVVRTCLSNGVWSGDDGAFCSNADPKHSFIEAPPALNRTAGGTLTVFYVTRDAHNTTVASGRDRLAVLLVSGPPGTPAAFAAANTYLGSGRYACQFSVGTLAGDMTVAFQLNGVPIGAGGMPRPLQVLPGPAVGPTSEAAGPGLTTAVIGVANVITVTMRDTYGNLVVDAAHAAVTATFKSLSQTYPVAVAHVSGAEFRVSYTAPQGGLFTLSIAVDGVPLADAPFLVVVNAICGPGHVPVEPTGPCIPCERSTYKSPDAVSSAGLPVCVVCPARTQSPPASRGVANCTCVAGWYAPYSTPGVPCLACPAGGVCAGGTQWPQSAPGYYPVETDDGTSAFVVCPVREACTGNAQCQKGYRGSFCSACAKGYYKLVEECHPCPRGRTEIMMLLFIVAAFCLTFLLVWLNTIDRSFYGFAAFTIGFNSLQITAIYGDVAVDWPDVARSVFSALTAANLNLDLTSPECSVTLDNPFLLKWGITMLLPILFLVPFATAFAVTRAYVKHVATKGHGWAEAHPDLARLVDMPKQGMAMRDRIRRRWARLRSHVNQTPKSMRNAVIRAYIHLLVFVYLPLAHQNLRFFDCDEVGGEWVWAAAPSFRCYSTNYWSLFPLAVLCAILYCAGIPVFVTSLLLYKRRSLAPFQFALRYGFLIARFHPRYFFFETLIMVRKLAVVVCVTAFHAPLTKGTMACLSLFLSFTHLSFVRPYIHVSHNLLACVCLASAVVVLLGGVTQDKAGRYILVFAGLIVNLGGIVVGVAHDIWIIASRDARDMQACLESGELHMDDHTDAWTKENGARLTLADNVALDVLEDSQTRESDDPLSVAAPPPLPLSASAMFTDDCASFDSFQSLDHTGHAPMPADDTP